MVKTLNINKLSHDVEIYPLSKVQLAEKCGISRVTLDTILKGKEIGLHKFLKLINVLGKNVGYYFDESPIEHYEAHGKHGIVAKNIGSIDNRDVVEVRKNDMITDIEEISEEIVLPKNCPEEAKHLVDRLTLEVDMLKRLLANAETRIAEKDERILELKERIEELKER